MQISSLKRNGTSGKGNIFITFILKSAYYAYLSNKKQRKIFTEK
jgi:hypothetical protein